MTTAPVAAIVIVGYEATKVTSEGEAFHGTMPEVQPELIARIKSWEGHESWAERWTLERDEVPLVDAERPHGKVRLLFDAIASGEKVVADAERADTLTALQRKVIAVEMEAHGFSAACILRHVPFLVVKSITDYADAAKNDDFHDLGCRIAADLVAELVADGVL